MPRIQTWPRFWELGMGSELVYSCSRQLTKNQDVLRQEYLEAYCLHKSPLILNWLSSAQCSVLIWAMKTENSDLDTCFPAVSNRNSWSSWFWVTNWSVRTSDTSLPWSFFNAPPCIVHWEHCKGGSFHQRLNSKKVDVFQILSIYKMIPLANPLCNVSHLFWEYLQKTTFGWVSSMT